MTGLESSKPSSTPTAGIPLSGNTCDVSLIDTTTDLLVKTSALLEPEIQGHEFLNLPTFAFYIYNPRSDKRLLFDMGSRKDWWNLPPEVVGAIEAKGVPGIRITKDIREILVDGGIDPATIDAVVWSHYHWDHVGNIQGFPSATKVVVGSGFRRSFLPGYPINAASPFYDDDFRHREVEEISFHGPQCLEIGKLRAFDYFNDQSFYLLSTPGHTDGHISALVRTSADTFIFLGGDICHFPGAFRPTRLSPMPDVISSSTVLDRRIPRPCPCSLFTACHPGGKHDPQTTPFYHPSASPESWYDEAKEAKKSLTALEEFDADENVFVAISHDPALREVAARFPQATLNDWKKRQLKESLHWNFLNELPLHGEPGRPKLVESRIRPAQA
ncbi:beta-lactamase-like protein [Dactylonectria estremocensis]|uniref:Beta-lactamase-like protein n=1 Tax=Dactylonectria estremocensis TaxID=1079267 RepID=A0A9P9DTR1_9HYPO|nr:beta-lactamase-like protein [Dactylonectria estremocensis]